MKASRDFITTWRISIDLDRDLWLSADRKDETPRLVPDEATVLFKFGLDGTDHEAYAPVNGGQDMTIDSVLRYAVSISFYNRAVRPCVPNSWRRIPAVHRYE